MTAPALSSVTNAVRVLKAFTGDQHEWGISELARQLDIGKSSAHRLVASLTAEGLLERDEVSGRYRVGLVAFDLAAAATRQLNLHEAIAAPMTDLRNRCGETVQVAVLDGRHAVFIERMDGPHTLRLFQEIGSRVDAHCSASGKALMAFGTPEEIDGLLDGWKLAKRTAHTITTHAALRRELVLIRKRGYSENRQEAELGVVSLGAPIRNVIGRTIAAISVAGPASRMDPVNAQLAKAVMSTAAAVSRRLGHRGPI